MNITRGTPPNFAAIYAVFPAARAPGVIFTYGDSIYVNGPGELSPQLKIHEGVHSQRQARIGVERWWKRYLVDKDFRLEEELVAHRAEYKHAKNRDREASVQLLHSIAARLASPLYGSMISQREARMAILNG